MDRALKERIIGITVLVVFAVIIVPVFLNGPADDTEVLTETLVLPGQDAEARKQQTIVLDRDRSEPLPAAVSTPATKAEDSKPEDHKPADDTKSPAVAPTTAGSAAVAPSTTAGQTANDDAATVAEKTVSETGMWAVQLGSFSNQANAERLAADLRKQGYAAFLSQLKTADGTLQRVRIGPQKDRASAEAVAAKLKAAGHPSQVVPHP
jgi:DedD protein